MSTSNSVQLHEKIQEFIQELNGFAQTAEETLKKIETDLEGNKSLFSVFTERMFTIRGTSEQLALMNIAYLAGLGEEISIKATAASTRSQLRKCVGSLWDALTTIKYLLEHYGEETGEEQTILIHRLKKTLDAFGGSRPKMSADEITQLMEQRNGSRG